MIISKFYSSSDNKPKPIEITWEGIFERLKKFEITDNKDFQAFSLAEYHTPNEKNFVEKKGKNKIYAGEYGEEIIADQNGEILRRNQNVRMLQGIIFDVDSGRIPGEELKKYTYCVYSTYSNTKENPKYRLIFPFSKPITPEFYKKIWPIAAKMTGVDPDQSCKDPARLYYLPSCPKETEDQKFYEFNQGEFFEPKLPEPVKKPKPKERTQRGDYRTLDIVSWFQNEGLYLKPASGGKHFVTCPWQNEHTDGKQGPTDSTIYDDANETKWPTFHCSHNHCHGKGIKEAIAFIGGADNFCSQPLNSQKLVEIQTKESDNGNELTVKALGVDDDGIYYYQSSHTNFIVPLSANKHNQLGFYSIVADQEYWRVMFGKQTERGVVTDWKRAAESLMKKCQDIGRYDPIECRGSGVWVDDKRVIAHLGKSIYHNNKKINLTSFDGKFTYETKAKNINLKKPLSLFQTKEIRSIINELPIPSKIDRAVLAGSIVMGPMSGALPWRPHIWITGEAGSGKSTIMSKLVSRLWKPCGGISIEGSSTEAGLRQKLKNNSVPVVADEMEGIGEKNIERIQEILSTIRSSSSDTDSEVLKGTTSGKGMSFRVKSMFCLGSIVHGLKSNQDKDRFSVIKCIATPESRDNWPILDKKIETIANEEYALGLFHRTLNLMPIILENIKVFKKVISKKGYSSRWGDQISVLLAGDFSLISDKLIVDKEAEKIFESFGDWNIQIDERISPSQDAVSRMLTAQVFMGNTRVAIGELVKDAMRSDAKAEQSALKMHGMKVINDHLYIAGTAYPAAAKFFEANGVGNYLDAFASIKGLVKGKSQRFIGRPVRSIGIPLGFLGMLEDNIQFQSKETA